MLKIYILCKKNIKYCLIKILVEKKNWGVLPSYFVKKRWSEIMHLCFIQTNVEIFMMAQNHRQRKHEGTFFVSPPPLNGFPSLQNLYLLWHLCQLCSFSHHNHNKKRRTFSAVHLQKNICGSAFSSWEGSKGSLSIFSVLVWETEQLESFWCMQRSCLMS